MIKRVRCLKGGGSSRGSRGSRGGMGGGDGASVVPAVGMGTWDQFFLGMAGRSHFSSACSSRTVTVVGRGSVSVPVPVVSGASGYILQRPPHRLLLRHPSTTTNRAISTAQPTSTPALQPSPTLSPSSVFPSTAITSPNVLPFPPSRNPLNSAKLAALHARLNLSPEFPLETLARCLIDSTAEPEPKFNNATLANLGNNFLGYLVSEHFLVKFPRLPIAVIKAAMWAYISPPALAAVGREWGVEDAFEATLEVDPGLLQFKRLSPGTLWGPARRVTPSSSTTTSPADPDTHSAYETDGMTINHPLPSIEPPTSLDGIPHDYALAHFVKSLFAAIYLHEGHSSLKQFFRAHILTRSLNHSALFDFEQPTRQLSRLCIREGFAPPVARLLATTGLRTRSAAYIVGVYSGKERLGEGYGASGDEARIKAAVNALKSWYLYSPVEPGDVPSVTMGGGKKEGGRYRPAFVDVGEIVV